MSDAELERLAHADYWDERYSETGPDKQYHEWFRSFDDLLPFFEQNLLQSPASETRILHLGSGDSTVPEQLAERGYNDQLCVDFSPVVVGLMSKRHAAIKGIEWAEADVRHMDNVPSSSIDIAFDKGTLDAMIHGSPWSPPDDVLQNTSQYIQEVQTDPDAYE
ncbi:uncharacterized protein DNG_02929 [Cephalotrichum gorgonifer]|uniref:Methyltransferase type 11 domain-containing protein n=1 Tax=Cephalotrichum gorgonifer TaxID=2041049 RepID=A0AAE8MV96_9PEZI|nr:uncharacterized protein DNG_02929 [Cephalotrichum gorgonifer]